MLHGKGNFVGVFRLGVTPFGHAACAQDDRRWGYGSMMRVSAISNSMPLLPKYKAITALLNDGA